MPWIINDDFLQRGRGLFHLYLGKPRFTLNEQGRDPCFPRFMQLSHVIAGIDQQVGAAEQRR